MWNNHHGHKGHHGHHGHHHHGHHHDNKDVVIVIDKTKSGPHLFPIPSITPTIITPPIIPPVINQGFKPSTTNPYYMGPGQNQGFIVN